jgi:hypothetical protein
VAKMNQKKPEAVPERIKMVKARKTKVMKYIKHLITLVSMQEIILHNLEREFEKADK